MRRQPWIAAAQKGLIWGGVAVFLALVGMVETFAGRQIVVGVISLGLALPVLTAVVAGYQGAQGHPGGAPGAFLARGALGGAAVGTVVSGLVVLGTFVNMRSMFVSASPTMFETLSFGRGVSGIPLVLLGAAAVGAVGAAASLLSPGVRRPLVTALAWTLGIGLFQELLQILLHAEGTRTAVRELLFVEDGLSMRGATIVFALAWGATAGWARRGGAVRQWHGRLSAPRQRVLRLSSLGAAVALLLLVPLGGGLFLSQVLVLVGLFALLGLGLNIVVGFAGLLDLGYVAFFAIGAYTVGLLTSVGEHGIIGLSFWAAVPVAVAVSLVAGVLLGVPVLGIRGDYLAIATLGFGEIIRILVLSDFLRPWLGGSQGVLGIPKPMIGGFEFRGPEQLFYLTLASCALVIFIAMRLRDSRLGRAWMAVREDEDVAEAMGINLVNVKLMAFAMGAAFGGLSGAIFAVMLGSIFPHSFQLLISINVLALIIVGGMGSMPGVIVGSLFLVGMPELLREFAEYRFLIYGASLVLMMQLRPEGLWPAAALRRELHAAEEMGPSGRAEAAAGSGRPLEE
ncbi:MAG: leucine/isoleucine/valine transporter permease subunit [Armatimonadetes bacterium]|nr:leucine/isoleucine/valine transporter permease subunit [Armatimonadota bacterium]